MLDLLRTRYVNPPDSQLADRWVFAEHVRSQPGAADRIADCIVMDMSASKGWELHGVEIKVSRQDWLSELRQPDKAAAFVPYMNRWWLAVPDPDIVHGDLPDGWGLLVKQDEKLVVARHAKRREPEPMPRALQAGLIRAAIGTDRSGRGLESRRETAVRTLREAALAVGPYGERVGGGASREVSRWLLKRARSI